MKTLVLSAIVTSLVGSSGCVLVPQNRRAALADPMMAFTSDSLEAHRKAKLYSSREGAAGGDGTTAGGGCACQ